MFIVFDLKMTVRYMYHAHACLRKTSFILRDNISTFGKAKAYIYIDDPETDHCHHLRVCIIKRFSYTFNLLKII